MVCYHGPSHGETHPALLGTVVGIPAPRAPELLAIYRAPRTRAPGEPWRLVYQNEIVIDRAGQRFEARMRITTADLPLDWMVTVDGRTINAGTYPEMSDDLGPEFVEFIVRAAGAARADAQGR
jgi:hypothetical protein